MKNVANSISFSEPDVPRIRLVPQPVDLSIAETMITPQGNRKRLRLRETGSMSLKDFLSRYPVASADEIQALQLVEQQILGSVRSGLISLLTARRTLAGLTQAEVARLLTVPQPQIARWEKPEHFEQISLANLRRLARALKIPTSALVEDLT